MSSCPPCPAIHTTGPGKLKISLWTPPMENRRSISALVATAAQPWPRHSAFASSPFGRSTIHSLLVSHEEKWRHCSLLRRRAGWSTYWKDQQKNKTEGLPGKLICAGACQQHSLLGKICHGVTQHIGEVHGMVYCCVVKLHVDGIVLLIVVASYNSNWVPHLRENSAIITEATLRNRRSDLLAI